jgi:hypothetical protein
MPFIRLDVQIPAGCWVAWRDLQCAGYSVVQPEQFAVVLPGSSRLATLAPGSLVLILIWVLLSNLLLAQNTSVCQ